MKMQVRILFIQRNIYLKLQEKIFPATPSQKQGNRDFEYIFWKLCVFTVCFSV